MGRVATLIMSAVLVLAMAVNATPERVMSYAPLTVDTPVLRVAVVGDSYTNGTAIGGQGRNAWPVRAWQTLARQGTSVTGDVAAEGKAGYGVRGDQGDLFIDLTSRAVRPDDAVVVFYGSRNDQDVDKNVLGSMVHDALVRAQGAAPRARILVIGTPWPTADVPPSVLQVRDVLAFQSFLVGATFVDPIAAGWFVDRPDLIGPDGVHPTDAGHAYMADRIAPLIGDQLPRRV